MQLTGSFALNLESGLFIAAMSVVAVNYGNRLNIQIPLPLPQPWATYAAYIVGAFFSGAVIYDVVDITIKSIDKGGLC